MSEIMLNEEHIVEIPVEFSHIQKQWEPNNDPFIIAGFASFDAVDVQGERIPLPVVTSAFNDMMAITERRNLMLQHTNYQVGRILPEWKDKNGRIWKSKPMENGLFIVAEIFKDRKRGQLLIDAMNKGHYLEFSIGGLALQRRKVCKGEVCWREITKLELNEVTSCERGANPYSKGFLMKQIPRESSLVDVTLIKDSADKKTEENEMSNPDMEPEKSDMMVLMEAIKANTESVKGLVEKLSEKPEDKPEVPEPLTSEAVGELIKTAIEGLKEELKQEPAPEEEPKKEPEVVKELYYKEPEKEDFEDEEKFNEAMASYTALKAAIMEEVKGQLGDAITKSEKPPEGTPEGEPEIDIKKLYSDADEVYNLRELVKRTK